MIRPLVSLSFLLALGLAAQTPPDFWATEKSPQPDLTAVMTRKAMGRDAWMPTSGGVFAHIAHGGPWRTLLTLINPSTSKTARAVLATYNTKGSPLSLTLSNGRKVVTTSQFEIELPPKAVMFLEPQDLPPDIVTGFAVIRAETGKVTGYAVFRAVVPGRPDMEAVVPLDYSSNDNAWIAFDNTRGFVTSVAIANSWKYSPCELIVDVYNEDGQLQASYRDELPEMSQLSFETPQKWPATAGRRGVVRLTAVNGWFTALALLFNPTGSVTTAPAPEVSGP